MVGNISNYTKADVLRCLFLISGSTSRWELKKRADLGEGTVRTILNILKDKKLIGSSKKGHFLTKKGKNLIKRIEENATLPIELKTKKMFPEYKKIAVVAKKHRKIKSFVRLRDIAVKNGTEGAIILLYKNSLKIPSFECEEKFDFAEKLFKYKNGDLLIITFGNNLRWCEIAAISILSEINDFLKSTVE